MTAKKSDGFESDAVSAPDQQHRNLPLRADARRNRDRVLSAAQRSFAEDGLSVSLDEIARRAGVGAGTVHRHFPTKEVLFEAVIEESFSQFEQEACEFANDSNSKETFYRFFISLVKRITLNKALCEALEALTGSHIKSQPDIAHKVKDVFDELFSEAQHSASIRSDVTVDQAWSLMIGCVAMERQQSHSNNVTAEGRMTNLVLETLRP